MEALNHNVRPAFQSGAGKLRPKREMRPVCLIHDQRHAVKVGNLCNGLNVRNHSLIGRRCDKHRLDSVLKGGFNCRRINTTLDSVVVCIVGIDIHRIQMAEQHRMIGGFMAVSGHYDLPAGGCHPADGAQDSPGAAVYHIISPVRPIDGRSPVHGFAQYFFRMVQVVKSVNLRDIHRKRIWKRSYPQFHLPFVSRHVERITVRLTVTD